MESEAEYGALETTFAGLEDSLTGLESVTGAFRKELDGAQGSMRNAGREATGMSRSISVSLRHAFDGLVFDGKRLSDTLAGIGQGITSSILNESLTPVRNTVESVVGRGLQAILGGGKPFQDGATLRAGRVATFANGGVVSGPTNFPMRGGIGLMGEAGPEAIVPLARGSDGTLGIRSGGTGGSVHVTMNISTPDAAGFQRSQSQIAAGNEPRYPAGPAQYVRKRHGFSRSEISGRAFDWVDRRAGASNRNHNSEQWL